MSFIDACGEQQAGIDSQTKEQKQMNDIVVSIAHVCHEANRAWAIEVGEDPAVIFPEWKLAPVEIQQSALMGVRAAIDGATPEQLHESWSAQKVKDGWVYGAVKDLTAKTHPCLVPYGDLPEAQRRKDALFSAIDAALR